MARKPDSMAAFVAAHLPKEEGAVAEKADKSLTVYLSASELERIETIKTRLSLSRQAVLRQMIVSGLEQFNKEAGWWK